MKKISHRIALIFILCSLLIIAVVTTSIYMASRKNLRKEAERNLLNLVQIEARKMDESFVSYQMLVENLRAAVEITFDMENAGERQEDIDKYEDATASTLKQIINVYDARTGWVIFNPEEVPGGNTLSFTRNENGKLIRNEEYDVIEEGYSQDDWWLKAIETGTCWTDPYYWENWDADVITYSVPVKVDGHVVGVAGTEIYFDALQERIRDITVYESGYMTLMNSGFDFLYHPDKSFENLGVSANGKFAHLIDTISNNEQGLTYYSGFNGERKILAWQKLSNGWILTANPNEKELFSSLNEVKGVILTLSIIVVMVALVIGLLLANNIVSPINKILEVVVELSHFDLRSDISDKLIGRQDEIGIMAKAVQAIKTNMHDLINDVMKTSKEVASSSATLAQTVHSSSKTSREIVESVHEISKGVTEQAENTTAGAEKLNYFGNLIKESKISVDDLNDSTRAVSQLVERGLMTINQLIEKTKENRKSVDEVNRSIKKTNNSANKIADASSLITTISEQTNLLALNAAIEAARAGEHGRGFAVVADEIRKLAEQSRRSTQIIDEMVLSLKNDAQEAVDKMSQASEYFIEQVESTEETGGKFRDIANAMNHAEASMTVLAEQSVLMEKSKNDAYGSFENLSAVAQENAASTEEAMAAIDEQNDSLEKISNSSNNLMTVTEDLQKLIEKFRLS